jgi:hypothetical protein
MLLRSLCLDAPEKIRFPTKDCAKLPGWVLALALLGPPTGTVVSHQKNVPIPGNTSPSKPPRSYTPSSCVLSDEQELMLPQHPPGSGQCRAMRKSADGDASLFAHYAEQRLIVFS